jgi:hypothetical protein
MKQNIHGKNKGTLDRADHAWAMTSYGVLDMLRSSDTARTVSSTAAVVLN